MEDHSAEHDDLVSPSFSMSANELLTSKDITLCILHIETINIIDILQYNFNQR